MELLHFCIVLRKFLIVTINSNFLSTFPEFVSFSYEAGILNFLKEHNLLFDNIHFSVVSVCYIIQDIWSDQYETVCIRHYYSSENRLLRFYRKRELYTSKEVCR